MKVGILTTWNQACGLASHAEMMVDGFGEHRDFDVVILAEKAPIEQITKPDAENNAGCKIYRCWNKLSKDYSEVNSIILNEGITLLHLNIHHRFFPDRSFLDFLLSLRSRGIKIICSIHVIYTIDQAMQQILAGIDCLIVHAPENELEALANGATIKQVVTIVPGVLKWNDQPKLIEKHKLGLSEKELILTTFGFVQPHKGMEGLIVAVNHLKRLGIPSRGSILGGIEWTDPNSPSYMEKLKQLANELNVRDRVTFSDGFVSDVKLDAMIRASDFVLMNYRSNYYEFSAVCARSLALCGTVLTSVAPCFNVFGASVWKVSGGFPIELSVELLARNESLRLALRERARQYCEVMSWQNVSLKISNLYKSIME